MGIDHVTIARILKLLDTIHGPFPGASSRRPDGCQVGRELEGIKTCKQKRREQRNYHSVWQDEKDWKGYCVDIVGYFLMLGTTPNADRTPYHRGM